MVETKHSHLRPQYPLCAPSMVFGEDLLENIRRLACIMDHVEVVLFHTPTLHNIPEPRDIQRIRELGTRKNIAFSVHLPASLEIASEDRKKRDASVQLALDIFSRMSGAAPRTYILHIPFSPPTLAPVPGDYFTAGQNHQWSAWTKRALESLKILYESLGDTSELLVENINYSPSFLEPFLESGWCDLCLDLGHLMLGNEKVSEILSHYLDVTREIHLHGVKGYEEHLSLSVLPVSLVSGWMDLLDKASYDGVVNLEVFSPSDLEESMRIIQGLHPVPPATSKRLWQQPALLKSTL